MFLYPNLVDAFGAILMDEIPEVEEIITVDGVRYQVYSRVWFGGEKFPFIAVKPYYKEENGRVEETI